MIRRPRESDHPGRRSQLVCGPVPMIRRALPVLEALAVLAIVALVGAAASLR